MRILQPTRMLTNAWWRANAIVEGAREICGSLRWAATVHMFMLARL
jgi:hypothetical protein